MKSSSESDQPLLKVDKVSLAFSLDLHSRRTWRDLFTSFVNDPLDTLAPHTERLKVLENVSFNIHKGDRIGILGVNGAGKTSLCRCLAGMYQPTVGKIERTVPVRAIFSSQAGIQPELTGRENAELLVEFFFPGNPDNAAIVEDALQFSELGKFLDVPYRLYSNGMQSRLCLSLISARPAGLLILDEVFDGADIFFREKISRRVLNMVHQSNATVFISHSTEQIIQVCNRALVLDRGTIRFDGTPAEAAQFYQTAAHTPPQV